MVTDGVCWGKRGIKRQPRETARFLTCTPVWVGMPFTEIRKQHFSGERYEIKLGHGEFIVPLRHPGRDVQWAIRYVDLELKGEVQRREISDSPVRGIMDREMTV